MNKKINLIILLLTLFSFMYVNEAVAKKITIKTIPETAQIEIDGNLVGVGNYTVKFDKNNDFYIVKVKCAGYITKTFRVMKSNPNNSVLFRLNKDEASAASLGGAEGADIANQWMDINCKRGMTEEIIWKRLMSVCTSYFDKIEIRDKSAGWIKTAWKPTYFENQVVRTRLEVRVQFLDDEVTSYRARLISEINNDLECRGDECYEQYPNVLRKFAPLIDELQTKVGGGE